MNRRKWAAWSIAAALLTTMVNIVAGGQVAFLAGVFYWLALVGLWPEVSARGRRMASLIVFASLPGLIVGLTHHTPSLWADVLKANNNILSMLVAVGFISVAAPPMVENSVRGVKGLLSTFANVHLIGAVINYSSVILFGDRIAREGRLTSAQAIVVSRAFAAAGFWSPFFATTAAALTYAPGVQVVVLLRCGLALAALSLFVSLIGQKGNDKSSQFEGVGFTVQGLRLPVWILLVVIGLQRIVPRMSILEIVTLVCPLVACISICQSRRVVSTLRRHVEERIPCHATELALFLSAGMFGVSLIEMLDLLPSIGLVQFGHPEAAVGLLAVVLLSLFGVHPLISISLLSAIAHTVDVSPNLLGFVIVASWAISSAVSPLSGQNLGIQGRYGVSSYDMMRWNLPYAGWMSAGAIAFIYLFI